MSLSACPSYSLLEAREKYLLSLKVLIYSLYPFFFSFPLTRAVLFVLHIFFFFSPAVLFFFFLAAAFSRRKLDERRVSRAQRDDSRARYSGEPHKKKPNCTTWSFDFSLCVRFLLLLLFLFTFGLLSIIAISLMHCVLIENT